MTPVMTLTMTPEEQAQLEALNKKVTDLEDLVYKNNFSDRQVFDKKVKFRSSYIPNVLTSIPTYTTAEEGETILVINGATTKKVCSFMNSTWVCQDYGVTTATSGITDVVQDTTPQLGGNLDTNDKGITSEGGRILRYSISKTLSDGVATELFRAVLGAAGGMRIVIDWVCGPTPGSSNGIVKGGQRIIPYIGDYVGLSAGGGVDKESTTANTGVITLGITWKEDIIEDGYTYKGCKVSITADNSSDTNNYFSAIVTIYSTVAGTTFTEL